MSAPGSRPVVIADDVARVDAVLGAWTAERPGINVGELRGLLLAALAEHRYAAYEEGVLTGRRIVANIVKEALFDEGLL